PAQDFEHHTVVVGAMERLDAIAAIALFVWLAFLETDHRSHSQGATDVGNIKTFNAVRWYTEMQFVLQLLDGALLLFVSIALLLIRQLGVLHGQLYQMVLITLLGHQDGYLASLLLGEQFGQ